MMKNNNKNAQKRNKNKKHKNVYSMNTQPKIQGHGDYRAIVSEMKNILKPVLKTALVNGSGLAGGALGNMIGAGSEGKSIGTKIGSYLSKLFGSGDYTTNDVPVCNSLLTGAGAKAQLGSFSSIKSFPLQHREYIGDVFTGNTAGMFSSMTMPVQPGLATFLPWGSSIANMFEEYKVKGMVFQYIPSTSPYNSSGAMGTVFMAMQYNAGAQPFTNKISMENSDFAISSRLDKPMAYGIECVGFSRDHYYVRNGDTANPIVDTDIGLFQIAVQPSSTFPTGSVIGELWVTYDLEFMRARLGPQRYGYYHTQWVNFEPSSTPVSTVTYGTAYQMVSTCYETGLIAITMPNFDPQDKFLVFVFSNGTTVSDDVSINGVYNVTTGDEIFNNISETFSIDYTPDLSIGSATYGQFEITESDPGQVPTINVVLGTSVMSLDIIIIDVASGVTL
jgi:hypothetical protein